MKHRLPYIAAALTLLMAIVCLILFMGTYDLSPDNWGPRGVEFEEWYKAWKAHRDRYVLIGICSLLAFVIFLLVGLWLNLKCARSLTSRSS
jgi:hypothetical protein